MNSAFVMNVARYIKLGIKVSGFVVANVVIDGM